VTRDTAARCVAIFDELRKRVGSVDAMREAFEYALAGKTVRRRVDASLKGDPALAALVEAVAERLGYTVGQLQLTRRRSIPIRDEVVWVVRQLSGLASYPELAKVLRRDHSSLVAGDARLARRLKTDEVLKRRLAQVVETCREPEAVAA